MTSTLFHADVVKWLKKRQWLAQNGYYPKYHAAFGDPPYALEFMANEWDGFDSPHAFQAWVTEWARLMLDFMHPGGLLAMCGGTRTVHRLASGLEDAGWEIEDEIAVWMYASGFPKSHAVSNEYRKSRRGWDGKAISNQAMERMTLKERLEWLKLERQFVGHGTAIKPSYEPVVIARAPREPHTYAEVARQFGSGLFNIDGARIEGLAAPRVEDKPRNVTVFSGQQTRPYVERAIASGIPSRPTYETPSGGRFPSNTLFICDCEREHRADCPIRQLDQQSGIRKAGSSLSGNEPSLPSAGGIYNVRHQRLAFDSYGDSGGASRFFFQAKAPTWEREAGLEQFGEQQLRTSYDKADRDRIGGDSVRYRRNIHPTVKPIQLTEYLARLLLPPSLDEPRRVLIPFAGVGSEMIGAAFAGWDEIDGVELTADYIPINEARRQWWGKFKTYAQAERAYKADRQAETNSPVKHGQLTLF